MKTFSQILENSKYVTTLDGLSNVLNESKEIQIPDTFEKSNLKKLTHVVLIGEMRYKSMRKQNIKLSYADPTKLEYTIKNGKIKVNDGEYKFELSESDKENTIVLIRSGYKNPIIAFLLKEIQNLGITILNNPDYVGISNNKFLTALLFEKYNIPQPKFCLVVNSDINKGEHDKLDKKLASIYKTQNDDTKFVCKILNGHGGKGVFVCSPNNILSILQTIFAINKDVSVLVQEYLNIQEGDVRANVLTLNGKQCIMDVKMRTKDTSDFRTNLSLGNSIKEYTLSKEQEKIVLAAAKASGLIWAGVDLLPLENNKNVIIEINGAPGTPTEINSDNMEESNYEFFKKFIEKINTLC